MARLQRCPKCHSVQQSPVLAKQPAGPVQANAKGQNQTLGGGNSSQCTFAATVHPPWQAGSNGFATTSSSSVTVNSDGKNMVLAYVLWWFLGFFGIHRFYLGRIGTGVTQLVLLIVGLVLSIVVIGYLFLLVLLVWWLLDAYFVYALVKESNGGVNPPLLNFQTTSISSRTSDLDTLSKLHDLYQRGAISQLEYEDAKLSLMRSRGP
jgi:TM2 domain-containing membrane protein YozV